MTTETAKHPIKMIVTDIDGTALNSDHQMTERTRAALKAAHAQGVKIVFATGKTHGSVKHIINDLGIPIYGIYLQGLMLMNLDGTTFGQQTIRPDAARQAITYADDRGFAVIGYSGNRLLARAMMPIMKDYTEPYGEPLPEIVGPLQNVLWNTQFHKIIMLGEGRAITGLRWQLNAQIGSSVRLVQAGIPMMLEVLPPNGGKAFALKTLLKELGMNASDVMAIGDAENDIEMIQLAGLGVAVGNADDKVKAAAKQVVSSNDKDGLAEAIERFVLPEPQPSTDKPAEKQETAT